MSLDNSIDSDIAAAFNNTPASQSQSSVDPDVAAAFSQGEGISTTPAADSSNPYDPNRKAIGDELTNQLHALASGAYHSVVGGYKGLYTLGMTHGTTDQRVNAATKAVADETAKTYQAPAPDLSRAIAPEGKSSVALQSAIRSSMQPTSTTVLGDWASREKAPPWLSTTLAVAPTAFALALNPSGAREVPGTPVPSTPPPAQEVVNNSISGQSMGAAGAPMDVSKLSPETQAEISTVGQSGGTINQLALQRHIEAETLPQPEGEGPLRLRAGQATDNPQQISDEKNLRADPDTQGILTDSIKTQDAKLASSLGEISRRSAPDIVQRTNAEHGQAAIDAIKAQDNAAILDIRAKYQALADANGGSMPIDTGNALDQINPALSKEFLNKTAASDPVISEVIDILGSGKPMTFEQFEDARTGLATVQRGGGSSAAAAGVVRNALENMPLTPEAAGLKGLADTARAAAKSRFDTIEQNPAYEAAVNDNTPKAAQTGLHVVGKASPLADSFMDRFVLGNGQTASTAYIARLKSIVTDPSFSNTIEAATLNRLKNAAGLDEFNQGTFRDAGYRNALAKMGPKADTLMTPETLANVQQLKNVSGYVNREGPAGSTNRSNTAVTLERHGAMAEQPETLGRTAAGLAGDVATAHFGGPLAVAAKRVVESAGKAKQAAAAVQALKDAKLKFAIESTKPGAGIGQ